MKPTQTTLTYTVIASSSPGWTTMLSQTFSTSRVPIETITAKSMPYGPQSTLAHASSTLSSATMPALSTPMSSLAALPTAATAAAAVAAPAAAAATDAAPRMTPAQIAGLSIAAVAAFTMAIALMVLSVFLRRQGEQRVDRDDGYEKGSSRIARIRSRRSSHYVALTDRSDSPARFPLKPARTARKDMATVGPAVGWSGHPNKSITVHSQQRSAAGTSTTGSNTSLPLDQIGIAISAELDNRPVVSKQSTKLASDTNQPIGNEASLRPSSTLTQETVFEEDDLTAGRTSSVPLPPLPLSIPPIRNLRASTSPPTTYDPNNSQAIRKPERSLDIALRNEKLKSRNSSSNIENGSPKPRVPSLRSRLLPTIRTKSSNGSLTKTASSWNAGHDGEEIDCYSSTQHLIPKASPAHFTRPKDSAKTIQIKMNKSLSSMSQHSSRGSSSHKNRDSLSSQTSFETDANDITPEEDDPTKRLQLPCSQPPKQALSPVIESPISNVRYPKVPRSANQHVPRNHPTQDAAPTPQSSPAHRAVEESSSSSSSHLSKRNHALPPLLLESRPRIHSPHRDPFVSPSRPLGRTHKRSTSAGATSTIALPPRSVSRGSRVRSGAWGGSPVMYEEEVVRPLNVRRRGDYGQGRAGAEGSSHIWAPKLTPTKGQDGDLWFRVGL